jgi:AAA family ATP:ADP antiporter
MALATRVEALLSRTLRPFAKVQPQEAVTTGMMTLAAFLLLTAYYLLKTVREPLILLHGGAEVKLYARAAQALLMLGVVHVYGEIARRVGRLKLLAIVFLFFVSNLAIFALLAHAKVDIGLVFFLWVGLFSYTSVAQLSGTGGALPERDARPRAHRCARVNDHRLVRLQATEDLAL